MHKSLFSLSVVLLLALVTLITEIEACNQETDFDCDGLPNELEDRLGTEFVPKMWFCYQMPMPWSSPLDEKCGPGMWDDDWCVNGIQPNHHQIGYLGYDVIDLGFSNLFAIQYTFFQDRDCGRAGFSRHYFDNEGFIVLLEFNGYSYDVLSVQTCTHAKSDDDAWDRMYLHEQIFHNRYWDDGLMMAYNKHGFYIHREVCAGVIYSAWPSNEICYRGDTLKYGINYVVGPYRTIEQCNCSPCDLPCLDLKIQNPDCWAERLMCVGKDCECFHLGSESCAETINRLGTDFLFFMRTQFPPWIPVGTRLPSNLAYVELFEDTNFTAKQEHLEQDEAENLGTAAVSARMPLKLINWPHAAWWEQYYDTVYQFTELTEYGNFGLRRAVFHYIYWKEYKHWGFADNIKSFILHGLPGTILVLSDFKWRTYGGWDRKKTDIYKIPDGRREVKIPDLGEMNEKYDFVTWGFGPLADAGPDRNLTCSGTVFLDARGSYEYALDTATVRKTFNWNSFKYSKDWIFDWYDESYNTYLGSGDTLTARLLCCGKHIIRLEVTGKRKESPFGESMWYRTTVSDWCTVNVELTAPENVLLVSLCDAIEVYWDTIRCAFGYKVYRDGDFLADVGKNAYYIDSTSGEHEYQVFSYDIWRNECGSAPLIGMAQKCVTTEEPDRLPDFVNQNYPNPFNVSTTIEYSLSGGGNVRLCLHNALGQRVRILVDQFQESGHHSVIWDGTDDQGITVSSGIYFYQLQTDHFYTRKKMVLLK